MTTAPDLRLQGVTVRYGSTVAVDAVDLEVQAGQIIALLGPSGSGKSSLLRAVAGLEPVADGDLLWRGRSIVDLPTHRRGFGLMFQDGQLFPHRDVAGNVAYGIRALPRAERAQRVREVLDVVGMGEYASRSVTSLSGGQAQRVALARSSIVDLPTHRRGFGLMFQDGQLFPHRDVAGNVAYGIRALPRAERAQRVREVLDVVGMGEYASRSVTSLSGGQAQRVALARSLAPRPELLLLDEPLSALDRSLRERLSGEIRQILRDSGASCIYVTHDQDEAFAVADRIGVMIDGRVAALASPQELWASPGHRDVAQFLGFGPFIPVGEGRWRAVAPGAVRVRRVMGEGEAVALTTEAELEALVAAVSDGGQDAGGVSADVPSAVVPSAAGQVAEALGPEENAATVRPVGVIVDARGGRGHSLVEVQMGDKTLKAQALPHLGAASDLVGALVELEVDLGSCPVVV